MRIEETEDTEEIEEEIEEIEEDEMDDIPESDAPRRKHDFWWVMLAWAVVIGILTVLTRIPEVSEWYVEHLFWLGSEITSRVTGLLPFSLGEIAIYLSIAWLGLLLILAVLLIFLGRKRSYRRFVWGLFKGFVAWAMLLVTMITLNLSPLYEHPYLTVQPAAQELTINLSIQPKVEPDSTMEGPDSTMEEPDSSKEESDSTKENASLTDATSDPNGVEPTDEEAARLQDLLALATLRNFLVERCNELSAQMPRDELGYVTYAAGESKESITSEIKEALRACKEDYPRLKGYYPAPKALICKDLMYAIETIGVYFPHTMEANYTPYITTLWYPYTIAHEFSHLKGYIYEDEANFLAYCACIGSDNPMIQYSGYINVLAYVDQDYRRLVGKELYAASPRISDMVWLDDSSYTLELIEKMEHSFWVQETPALSVSQSVTQGYLTYYHSKANYNEVTKLLLTYYGLD